MNIIKTNIPSTMAKVSLPYVMGNVGIYSGSDGNSYRLVTLKISDGSLKTFYFGVNQLEPLNEEVWRGAWFYKTNEQMVVAFTPASKE